MTKDRGKEAAAEAMEAAEEEKADEAAEDSLEAPEEAEESADGEEAGNREAEESAEEGDTKYLRLAADFQNYKKRVEKERFERYSEGKKDFAADILPVLDNFDRALIGDAAAGDDEGGKALADGMEMILKQFLDVLAKNGVNEIEALGEAFDPNVHHAVLMEPSEGYASQTVSEVFQKGYRIGDKVIRPAMVKVAE